MGLHFVPFSGLSSSCDQVLGERSHCDLSPSPSLPLSFLGVQLVHLLWCSMCLFWGADLWLPPSWHMSTVQNPKKSWLAMKPACSLVDDASLGLQLPPSGSGCPRLPVSGRGWDCPQPASSAQSFVLCVGLAVSYVRAFCGLAIPQSGLLSQVSFLGLPSGHSGPVLTLSNIACASSLSGPRLLVADTSRCAAFPLGVPVRHVICGF